ncbi:MAG TPA: GspH/FimT family pseudopilin [Usitatibacter sp.]
MIRAVPQRGFSIIELLIAISIVAMLLLFAAPSASTWIQNTRLRSSAESVVSCLTTARLEAIKRNTNVSCQMTDASSSAWNVCLYDAVNNVCFTAAGSVLAQRDATEDNGITTFGLDTTASASSSALGSGLHVPGSATFNSFGRLATGATNTMRVDVRNTKLASADERRLVIYITLGGQIHMCDPKLSYPTSPQACSV